MVIVAKHYPEEFRRDVVSVARKHEAPLSQIAKDFGISGATLSNWLKRAEVEDGIRPGLKQADAAELRELKKPNRLLEQENEILRRAAAFLPGSCPQNGLPAGPLTLPRTGFP
jgi:transposase-like protein